MRWPDPFGGDWYTLMPWLLFAACLGLVLSWSGP